MAYRVKPLQRTKTALIHRGCPRLSPRCVVSGSFKAAADKKKCFEKAANE